MMKAFLIALAATVAMPAFAQGKAPMVSYIQAGALLDRPGSAPRGNSTIIVRDGKVAELRNGFVAPEAGATLIDLRNAFVLPGLVDMHVHLWGIGGDPLRARLEALNRDRFDDEMT
ncbi:hypothetical protein ACP6J5_13335, partial [Staphylococcus simulans]